MADNKVLICDPWNGPYETYPPEDVFDSEISSALGRGHQVDTIYYYVTYCLFGVFLQGMSLLGRGFGNV